MPARRLGILQKTAWPPLWAAISESRPGVTIECEQMTPQPGMPFFSNQGGFTALACNGYIGERSIQVATAGRYTLELVASGTPAAGVFPLVAVADRRPAGGPNAAE